MSAENMDLGAVIASLETKRAALDNAIAALRAVAASGALGPSPDGTIPSTVSPFSISGGGNEVPDGVFNGKSIPSAIKLYLEVVRSKKTAREISDGLKKGGLESTSKFFDKIVYATLDRLRKNGDVIKIGPAWGLPAWYPALMRAEAKAGKSPKRQYRKVGRPRNDASQGPKLLAVASEAKPPRKALKSEPGPSDMIDWFLRDNPGVHTSKEIQTAAQIHNIRVAEMLLGRLVKKGKVAKTEDGKYRKAS